MGKKMIVRLAVGLGVTSFVTLVVQFWLAMRGKSIVTPGFAARFPSEAAAVLAQLGLVGFIGMAFAGAARIFEIERWSFLKQGIVHFLITAAVWMPIAWLCWMPMPACAIWISVGGWTLTYAVNWLAQYFVWRWKVRELDRSIRAQQEEIHESN